MDSFSTHTIANTVPPRGPANLFDADPLLPSLVQSLGGGWGREGLSGLGQTLGRPETAQQAADANRNKPVLHTHDREGRRLDRVDFHPSWHMLMSLAQSAGLSTGPYAEPRPGAHLVRAAGFFLMGQVEAGVLCPTTMTYGAAPILLRQPQICGADPEPWRRALISRRYDPAFAPAVKKKGVLIGMGMTEKQGGSDVRANTTTAEPLADGSYAITGHKWFFSVPSSDAWLITAQAPEGLTCFFLPRFLPDGTPNALLFQRLKDKLGNHSNASSEVEFQRAIAWPVGVPGKGVPTIIEMATYTRLDCVLGTAAMMRASLAEALHVARRRRAFGQALIDLPLMRRVLADLALDSAATMVLGLAIASAYDRDDETAMVWRRAVTPVAKFHVTKRGAGFAAEAMEVMGGNGYVEDAPLARIYREMPVNAIWEGSGNIMALDMLKALLKGKNTLTVIAGDLEAAAKTDSRLAAPVEDWLKTVRNGPEEADARRLADQLARLLSAALLMGLAPPAIADAYIETRIRNPSTLYGAGPSIDTAAILATAPGE